MDNQISKYSVFKGYLLALFGRSVLYGDIDISGGQDFINNTIAAIDLLKKKDPVAYEMLNEHISCIIFKKNYPHIIVVEIANLCFVGKKIAEYPTISYAALLALPTSGDGSRIKARPGEKLISDPSLKSILDLSP